MLAPDDDRPPPRARTCLLHGALRARAFGACEHTDPAARLYAFQTLETWLQRARRVVFFSDAADQNAPMDAPLIGHAFENTPGERIFAGGNWRAVPILRSMAQLFFSAEAQAALAARGEPPPKWAYMADDDSFAFTSELLAELGKRDPDGKHYLGYAFLAAPHVESVVLSGFRHSLQVCCLLLSRRL